MNETLRDCFVCGLKSEVTQKRLLSETNLTLNRTVEIAQGIEAAEQHTQQLMSEASLNKCLQQTTQYLASTVVRAITMHLSVILRKPFVILIIRKDIWQRFAEPKGSNN